jgi:TRAP transporter TAXI family solute receptor
MTMKHPKKLKLEILTAAIVLAVIAGAIVIAQSRVPSRLVMASGPPGSAYALYAEQYRMLLARSGVEVQVRPSGGTVENLKLLNDPAANVDVAFVSAGTTSAEKSPDLRTLGTVFIEAVWFFSRESALVGGSFDALRGKRVSIGVQGSATRAVAETILRLNRFDMSSADFVSLSPQAAAGQLRRGDIQAALMTASADLPIVRELLADPDIDLISFPRAAAYVALYPFLTRLTVPEGVGDLASNRPPHDVEIFGAPVSLVVRDDMHPALQALLLRAASQIHAGPGMFNAASRFPAAEAIDLPLSDGATQYYKSGIPLLQRHLPFGLAVLVGQLLFILLPIVGILYPLLRLAPALYAWAMRHRIIRLYGELKLLEHELDNDPDSARKRTLLDELDQLDRRVVRMHIPASYSQFVYTLRQHIGLVRSRV